MEPMRLTFVPVEAAGDVDFLTSHNHHTLTLQCCLGHKGRKSPQQMPSGIDHYRLKIKMATLYVDFLVHMLKITCSNIYNNYIT